MAPPLPTSFLILLALVLPLSQCAYQCQRDEDCSLNGLCVSSYCKCDYGWIGDDCGVLDLRPATHLTGYNRTDEGISSWGGKVIQDPSNATLFHLFAAEFTHSCNLDYWSPYSRIIRAVSDRPEGPYRFANEVVGAFAHNPTVIFSEAHQLWLMVHIGCKQTPPQQCYGVDISCDPGNTLNGESGITLRAAKQLDGDWQSLGIIIGTNGSSKWDGDTTNPSLLPLRNGSLVLAYRGCPFNCGGDELINVAFAHTLAGPFTRLQSAPIFGNGNEDPFIWQDARGNWHLLLHSLEPDGGFGGPRVGRHAFARSFAGPWTFWSRTLTFNTTATFTDGSSIDFFRRERPQLFFDAQGRMRYLINGVQEHDHGQAYTFIQPIGE